MSIDVKYVNPSTDPVIDVLEDAMDCDSVILMGWKDGSLYITQSQADTIETLATLDLAREFLRGTMINTSGVWH